MRKKCFSKKCKKAGKFALNEIPGFADTIQMRREGDEEWTNCGDVFYCREHRDKLEKAEREKL
jgi:hypothetical protein